MHGEIRGCDWICWNPDAIEIRRDEYCDDKSIRAACPLACGECEGVCATRPPVVTPTKKPIRAPTTSPVVTPTVCKNDEDFTFELMNFEGYHRGCDWICWNPDHIKFRRKKYCRNNIIRAACPLACGECEGVCATRPPVVAPTKRPTRAPTASPVAAPSICVDDKNFTFELMNQKGKYQVCGWICWNPDPDVAAFRKKNYCGIRSIAKSCPLSCGLCTP